MKYLQSKSFFPPTLSNQLKRILKKNEGKVMFIYVTGVFVDSICERCSHWDCTYRIMPTVILIPNSLK